MARATLRSPDSDGIEPAKPARRPGLVGGVYSLLITAVVAAILIVVNVFVGALPTSATSIDISASKLYSITSNTKAVVSGLDQDVTIYWIVQAGDEDGVIENLLSNYESLSDHINVQKRNPDVYPTFAEQYTDETVANNSLVVESEGRNRYIGYDAIYVQDADTYSYSYTTSFDGEGAITSAIDYVINPDQPIVYLLEGHGESELPSQFADSLTKANVETGSLSLLTSDAVPDDASAVLVYGPTSDISEKERDILADYVGNNGKLLVMAGPAEEDDLDVLNGLLGNYGVEVMEGIVVDADAESYAFDTPYVLLPEITEDDITSALIEENYYVTMPISGGLTLSDDTGEATVTTLLTTSDQSFSKVAGYALSTYEKEDGDVDGPFALAVSVADGDGQLIWFTSSTFLSDEYNAYSSGANGDLAMNALSSLIGEREALAIRSKSLNYNYLTISDSSSSTLTGLMVGVFPLAFLGFGIGMMIWRRRLR